jgi:hypothetical protein
LSDICSNINYYNPGDASCASDPCWYDASIDQRENPGTHSVVLECSADRSCKGFQFNNIGVFPQPLLAPEAICINVFPDVNPALGFSCPEGNYNGTFIES